MSGRRGLRITGGQWRGRRVPVPRTARPTTERVREAVWARWQPWTPGAQMLDLYAGSGAMSLEAMSRGAASSVAVEDSKAAVRQLERSAAELQAPIRVVTASLPGHWERVVRQLPQPVDLVYLDPPYQAGVDRDLLEKLNDVLAVDARIAVEHTARQEISVPPQLEYEDCRRYGETAITYLRQS